MKRFELKYWPKGNVGGMSAWKLRRIDNKAGGFPPNRTLVNVFRDTNLGQRFAIGRRDEIYVRLYMSKGMTKIRREMFLELLESRSKV